MASISTLHFNSLAPIQLKQASNVANIRAGFVSNCTQLNLNRRFFVSKACLNNNSSSNSVINNDADKAEKAEQAIDFKTSFGSLQATIRSLPSFPTLKYRNNGSNLAIGLCIAVAALVISIRLLVARKSRYKVSGSVADLVRRGQLRSDRRGISTPLKFEDPFNNPLVRVAKSNSSVEMCGKVYRLAPVTLTEEQQAIHKKRRSRAYQWKRPEIYLKEGDSIPDDVDPDTIRWIPTNHPFVTTDTDIDEGMAQNNMYQKHGVPFRIQAEHDAMQRKLEALQNDQKLNKLVIDPADAKDFERPLKTNSRSYDEFKDAKSDQNPNSFGSNLSSDDASKKN